MDERSGTQRQYQERTREWRVLKNVVSTDTSETEVLTTENKIDRQTRANET